MASSESHKSWLERLGLKRPSAPPPRPRTDTTYHAVSIVMGPNACTAAHRFTSKRFLSRQAPPLPLPTCDAFHCECRFRHHKDRRAGPRRRSDIGLAPAGFAGAERRSAGGRRKDDLHVTHW